jgi:hypothetical protein
VRSAATASADRDRAILAAIGKPTPITVDAAEVAKALAENGVFTATLARAMVDDVAQRLAE